MTQVAPGHHSALQDNLMSLGNGHQPWESLELKVIFLMQLSLSVKRCVSNKQKDELLRKLVQMYVNNASMINEDATT